MAIIPAGKPPPAEPVLGTNMHVCGVTLIGTLSIFEWKRLLSEITHEMRMTPVHRPAIFNYPVDGKGGLGMTLVQPITESFIALDTWPDHKGAYLMICSCRYFQPTGLFALFGKYDLGMGQDFFQKLSLRHG